MLDFIWNVMAQGEAREGKWRGNWRMEWVASTLHTTSEHSVSSITTADAHTSAASSRLNWRPRRFKWNRPFRRKTKSGFCACAITFYVASTIFNSAPWSHPPTGSPLTERAPSSYWIEICVAPGLLCILWRRNKPQRCRDSKQFCQFHQSVEFLNQESD